jgi:hypothetical protein
MRPPAASTIAKRCLPVQAQTRTGGLAPRGAARTRSTTAGGDVTVQAKAAACEQTRHVRFVASALCQTAASLACTKIIRKRAVSKRWRMAAVAGGRQRKP